MADIAFPSRGVGQILTSLDGQHDLPRYFAAAYAIGQS